MSNNGWISLHRKIRDNWIWEDSEKLKAWIDILLEVNHGEKQIPFNGHIITIKRGQKLTSLSKLAERWGWTRNRVGRFIDLLIEADMVTANRTPSGTLLTVVNYGFYQDARYTNRAANEATNEAGSEATYEAANEAQTIMNNKTSNNDNNFLSAGAQKKVPPAEWEVTAYCKRKDYHIDVAEFMAYYNMRGWALSGGKLMTDWEAAVDAWQIKGRKLEVSEVPNLPCYVEFDSSKEQKGTAMPFKGGLASEMLRRKREKVANE